MRIWPGERFWPVALVNYFTLWFGILLIPSIFLALLFKDKLLVTTLVVAIFLIAGRFVNNFLPKQTPICSGDDLKVMTFNVHQQNLDVVSLSETIINEEADIVALQEIPPKVGSQLVKVLAGDYPYHTLNLFPGQISQGLLSRYPIEKVSEIHDYNYQSAVIQTNQGQIKFINVHAPTLFPSSWKRDWQEQREYFENIMADVRTYEGAMILAGDLNSTPQSENYALVARELQDSFHTSGWGFGFTYPAKPKFGVELPTPLVRIDYIFVSDHYETNHALVNKENGGSDHFPISSCIRLKEL